MRKGEDNRDLTALEKKAGQAAARKISRKLKSLIRSSTVKRSGDMLRISSARAVIKFDALDHIAIRSPHYAFKQHHGFEGIKKNGVRMRLKATNLFDELLDNNKTLEELADTISDLRGEEITSQISW